MNAGLRHTWPRLAPALLLAAAVAAFWGPALGGARVPVAAVYQQQMPPFGHGETTPTRAWDALLWDSMAQFYPWRALLGRGLRSGELPLWNPHQYSGYPLVGNGQSALFYPPNWLLLAVPPRYFVGLSLALHALGAALLTFLLGRVLGLAPLPAAYAALAYALSGFMITWALLPTVVSVMTWLPGAWLGIELLFRRRRLGTAVLAGSLGLALLAGHLQFAAYVWLAAAAYALARTVYRWATRRPAPLAGLALAVLLGLGLGLAQLLPSLELGAHSPRGGQEVSAEGWRFQQQRALQPVELLTFLWPEALGDPVTGEYPGLSFTEHCGFAGALTLVLAALGLAGRRDRWSGLFAGGAILALSAAMAGPVAWFLYFYVPKLGLAGGFARILGVYTLCLALLAGFGLDWLGRRAVGTSGQARLPGVLAVAAVAILLLELVPWGQRFLPWSPPREVYPATALTQELTRRAAGGDRCLAITPRAAWSLTEVPPALLPPNAATAYGWSSPQGYDSLYLAAYREYAVAAEGADVSPLENGNLMLLQNPDSRLLDEAGVRWIASLAPLAAPGLELEGEIEGVFLYRNQRALPRAQIAAADSLTEARVVESTLNRTLIEADSPGALLTVADAFYPGWRAYLDGMPVEMRPTQDVFRQVDLPPGRHWVWMVYYPATVVVGLFFGLLSLGLIAGLTAWELSRGRYRTDN